MGFEKPSPIQEEAIPPALKRTNIIAKAKTGTGKTGAYAIPVIQMIDKEADHIQALVIVPTRELALQTSSTLKNLSKYIELEIMVSTGGTSVKEDVMRLSQTVHILVGTPGRILDLTMKKVADLSKCRHVVVDEVDKLLSDHFMPVTEKLFSYLPDEKQILLFSATYPKETTQAF